MTLSTKEYAMTNQEIAVGIIDAQRGFMPAEEGLRLNAKGFGELPVAEGAEIVPFANTLLGRAALLDAFRFTTQDWHPAETAHFAAEPNYNTTWPVHCVELTAGAELHPELIVVEGLVQYRKGNEKLLDGANDTSYTGFNGLDENGQTLGERLVENGTTVVVLGGLATDYCVKASAIDFANKLGLEVIVASDAIRGVMPETTLAAIDEIKTYGVKFQTTEEILAGVLAA